jgi:hypothetical protein
MPTKSGARADFFPSWNPHFTPEWLSHRIARYIAPSFSGAIVDPACGAGNLLAAAAIRTKAYGRPKGQLQFVGLDTSTKAVTACRNALAALLPQGNTQVRKKDFLRPARKSPLPRRVAIVMNPPFSGYGSISKSRRLEVTRHLKLRGRFNLSYAFVHRAIELYRPEVLIALLPSNWMHSRRSSFKSSLDALGGKWTWDDIGDWPRSGISAHVGILVWRPGRKLREKVSASEGAADETTFARIEVRQGVATGRDELFCQIANAGIPFGKKMLAVRGRDVARRTSKEIWLPPSKPKKEHGSLFRECVSEATIKDLRTRSCVVDRGREIFEYHETPPSWFHKGAKILVPEILSGRAVRVELDADGRKLPLHSVFAIKVPSKSAGKRLRDFLQGKAQQKRLLKTGPRLSGGAIRLQVGALRDVLSRFEKGESSKKRK